MLLFSSIVIFRSSILQQKNFSAFPKIYAEDARYLGGIPVAEMYEGYLREHLFKPLPDMYFFSSWLENYRYEFELLSYLGLGKHLARTHPGLRSISEVILTILPKLTPSSD
ncbi:hypothetical protein HMPREF9163_01103 [Selenomonas sp. oral taxon 138 str. F0429]|nr:hypothetical protein HMPREF9163_01103 [Selenomonas sp. oral taxon 138 str. F0429]